MHEPRAIDDVVRQCGIPERSFKRRFRKATGHAPIDYVQRLRIEAAKLRLEAGNLAVDAIGFEVGYQDPAFFRRLFKRTTGLTPGAYRKSSACPTPYCPSPCPSARLSPATAPSSAAISGYRPRVSRADVRSARFGWARVPSRSTKACA